MRKISFVLFILFSGCGTSLPKESSNFPEPIIRDWQKRELESKRPAYFSLGHGTLRGVYERLVSTGREILLYDPEERLLVLSPVIKEAFLGRYRADPPISSPDVFEQFPTTRDVMEKDGEDCDGLALVLFRALRDLGFKSKLAVLSSSAGNHVAVAIFLPGKREPLIVDVDTIMHSSYLIVPLSYLDARWTLLALYDEEEIWWWMP